MALIRLNNQSLPSGSVLQVVQFFDQGIIGSSKSSLVTLTNADGYSDVMSKAIITEAANSKILVQIKTNGYDSTNSTIRGATKIFRNSTEIDGDPYAFYGPPSIMFLFNSTILDAPAAAAGTTITYKLQAYQVASSGNMYVGYGDTGGGCSSLITLTEISI